MKLSEMNFDQACDATVRLVDPIARITADTNLEPVIKELAEKDGKKVNNLQVISEFLPKLVPILLKDHREDTCEILSIMSGESKDDIRKKKLGEIARIIRDSFDEEFLGFFTSSGNQKTRHAD